MSQDDDYTRQVVARCAAAVLGEAPQGLRRPSDVMVSPVWRGVEGDIWVAGAGGRDIALKQFRPEASFYADFEPVALMTELAGKQGVGPAVLAIFPEERILVMDNPGVTWRVGGLQDAVSEPIRRNVIRAKRAIQAGPRFPVTASVFDEIPTLAARAVESGAQVPSHLPAWLETNEKVGETIDAAGIDLVPSHRDGNMSNLLINEEDEILLLDFDLAANADPFEGLGCYLREFFDGEPESRDGFVEWYGSWDEGLYERSMLYGLADDLRWGLIGSILQATCPTTSLEYSKYASWRFLRYEYFARGALAADRLRRMR